MNEDIGNLKGASGSSVIPVNANKVPGTQLATTVDKSNPASRKKFAAVDDVVLLRAVNAFQPWRAPVGTAKEIMKVFDDIAVHCGAHPEIGVNKRGTALCTRFITLLRELKRDQCQSMRRSGFVEQFGERDRLLLDIIAQTDDWNEKLEATNKIKEAKQVGIESSGELMRRLAMNESVAGDDDDENDDDEEDSDAASKITKRERLAVVMDALTGSLKTTSEDDGNKYEFKAERLAFEQDQAEKQRLHEAAEAEKRRQHELDLETHRQKADEEREKRMFDLLESVLM
ncbi:hypothetical protein GN958_ATG00949 [Phytophthora infestans]|uniref:Uncharacterized protein n=1 Tax=Phytophthora infestans TaxID=4787 RepID=A0A8S9VA49_PHYIN|nr:hypothetical protein GN958_ATG00949 [Phytophthora infestans]